MDDSISQKYITIGKYVTRKKLIAFLIIIGAILGENISEIRGMNIEQLLQSDGPLPVHLDLTILNIIVPVSAALFVAYLDNDLVWFFKGVTGKKSKIISDS